MEEYLLRTCKTVILVLRSNLTKSSFIAKFSLQTIYSGAENDGHEMTVHQNRRTRKCRTWNTRHERWV